MAMVTLVTVGASSAYLLSASNAFAQPAGSASAAHGSGRGGGTGQGRGTHDGHGDGEPHDRGMHAGGAASALAPGGDPNVKHADPAEHGGPAEVHGGQTHAPETLPNGTITEHGAVHGESGSSGAEHGAEHGEHHLAPINWTGMGTHTPPFIALVFNFALLVVGYYAMGKKPVQKALVDRRQAVAREIEEASRLLREAEERAKVYQAKLANLESEIESAKRALTDAGKGDRDRILREADEKAARMKRDATTLVDQEVKQIRQDLLRETIDMASRSASTILRERVTQDDHERLANEFLAELGQQKGVNA